MTRQSANGSDALGRLPGQESSLIPSRRATVLVILNHHVLAELALNWELTFGKKCLRWLRALGSTELESRITFGGLLLLVGSMQPCQFPSLDDQYVERFARIQALVTREAQAFHIDLDQAEKWDALVIVGR